MRAHYISRLTVEKNYILRDDVVHHLIHVVRIEAGEELLLLNGAGVFIETRVEKISKKELHLVTLKHYEKSRHFHFDLALAMPKREALELCLKEATELGFRNVFLIRSDYSQMRMPDTERIEKLLVSALEQSNAPFLPFVLEATWDSIPWSSYAEALLMDSQTKIGPKYFSLPISSAHLLIVGPEGGFSPHELSFLHAKEQVKVVNLPTPILRTPTAVATGAGMMIESLLK